MSDKKVILIVDDDMITVYLLKTILSNHYKDSYLYETALNAREAINIIEKFFSSGVKVQLIISDLVMPEIKGDELILKVQEKYPDIKAIMISGYADREIIDELHASLNLSAFITKPWENENLIFEVNRCFD